MRSWVSFEAAVGKIRGCGYKVTPQRLAILAAIAADIKVWRR